MRGKRPSAQRMLAFLAASWLVVAYLITTTQAAAMVCSEANTAPVSTVAEAPMPPCHGHGSAPVKASDEPEPRSPACSPLCQLLCHGLALLDHPALAVPLVAAPDRSFEHVTRPLPLLPDTIDHVPL